MRLSGIRPGDILRVDDGLPYLAEVIERDGTHVRVAPITGPRGMRAVKSRDVVDHWRKVRLRHASDGRAGPPCREAAT